jgi:hypothetical protein
MMRNGKRAKIKGSRTMKLWKIKNDGKFISAEENRWCRIRTLRGA